jgi:hypothetical protein
VNHLIKDSELTVWQYEHQSVFPVLFFLGGINRQLVITKSGGNSMNPRVQFVYKREMLGFPNFPPKIWFQNDVSPSHHLMPLFTKTIDYM